MSESEDMFPAIEKAYRYHNRYVAALKEWRSFHEGNTQKIALWSSIFWTFENASYGDEEGGLDVNLQEMREAVDLPGETDFDESLSEVFGFDEDTKMSDIVSGKLSMQDRFDEAVASGQPPFVTFGRRINQKRSTVENAAQDLHNHMFYGGPNKKKSDLGDGERCAFQKELQYSSYEGQVKILKKLTAELAVSQFGREILSKLVDPWVPTDGQGNAAPTTKIHAVFLFDPTPKWSGRIGKTIANVPGKSEVQNDQSQFLALDSNGDPYVKDLRMANHLLVLAGQLMPGISHHQAREQGDLQGGNMQLSMIVSMLDGGVDRTSWKRFKQNSGSDQAQQVFTHLTNAITASDTIIQEFGTQSASRYQVSSFESAGSQAKLRQYQLYSANFAGLLSLIGTAWGAIAKANEDQLTFDMAGIYSALGNMHGAADLYQGMRDMAGMEYDEVALKDGKFVKYSNVDDAATSWGKTALDWVGKSFDVIDAFVSAYTSYTAASEGEYDVALLAGLGVGLAIGGLLVGGWVGVVLALAGMLVGYLQGWVTDGAVTKWIRRSVFGDTEIDDSTNQDPASKWFGFKGYERITGTAGAKKQRGINRQIAEFYNIIMPFSLPDTISISKQSDDTYNCVFTLSDLANGGGGSSFLFQPIYVKRGGYKVGEITHDISPLVQVQGAYKGIDETVDGVRVRTDPTFEGSAANVTDPSTRLTDLKIMLTGADKISDIFDISPFTVDGAQTAYLEVVHAPTNIRSSIKRDLTQAMGSTPADSFVDAVVDNQPYPRQRAKLEVQGL
jgi:hypothetical protein